MNVDTIFYISVIFLVFYIFLLFIVNVDNILVRYFAAIAWYGFLVSALPPRHRFSPKNF